MSKRVSAKRKAVSFDIKLWRLIKNPLKKIKYLAKDGDVVELFKYCYPNLWKDVCGYHNDMIRWNHSRRLRQLYDVYSYKKPEDYLRKKATFIKATPVKSSSDETDEDIIEIIREDSLKKIYQRNRKTEKRERYTQNVTPSYVGLHKKAYYHLRKSHPDDIDSRYLVVHEMAKYKCDETIRFLEQLVRCEKNLPLQHYAWECLNKIGITGVHKGRRHGKKKFTHLKGFFPISSPSELLKAIYNSPLEQMKCYDLFLSHSYRDKEKLIELKDLLNASGLNVYMDWINDKDELLRTLTSADTAKVITERINASKAILYVHTNSSLDSKWTPWELGYAYAIKKPILIYRPEETDNEPEYLQLHKFVEIKDKSLVFVDDSNDSVVDWIRKM